MVSSRFTLIIPASVAVFVCTTTPAPAEAEEARSISVRGNAAVQVVPDEVVITLGVETNNLDVQVARQENESRVHAVKAVADKFKIQPQHVQTDYLSIQPRWDTHNGERRFLGYWCSRSIVVWLNDFSHFEQFLAESLTAGANYVHGIDFRTTELRKHRERARQMAIRAAWEKARALAAELGLGIGTARNIGEGSSGWSIPSHWGAHRGDQWSAQNVVQVAPSSTSDDGESALATGQINVTAEISVTFDLETTGSAPLQHYR